MPAVKVKSDQTGKDFLEANKNGFVVLIFDAAFTDQATQVENVIDVLSKNDIIKDRIVLGLVDVEENNDLATRFSVESAPMVVCLARGKEVLKIGSLDTNKLTQSIQDELKRFDFLEGGSQDTSADSGDKFKEHLVSLINKAPVMVFMKGHPNLPRCGFSRQLVELLTRNEIKYETFDILEDDDVRQGLKEYSDWPTYPQIYVRGEFIGGLDILKQMEESNELKETLK